VPCASPEIGFEVLEGVEVPEPDGGVSGARSYTYSPFGGLSTPPSAGLPKAPLEGLSKGGKSELTTGLNGSKFRLAVRIFPIRLFLQTQSMANNHCY
jgi:hypothetical protein